MKFGDIEIGAEYVHELLTNVKLEKKCQVCITILKELRKEARKQKKKEGWE